MSFHLPFHYKKLIHLTQSREKVFSSLSDYPISLPKMFPGLKRFKLEGDKIYFWEFEPLNYGGKELCVSFRTTFEASGPFELKILPLSSKEETQLRGSWKLIETQKGCSLEMNFELDLLVPLPKLTKSFLSSLAQTELNKLFNRYVTNVENAFK